MRAAFKAFAGTRMNLLLIAYIAGCFTLFGAIVMVAHPVAGGVFIIGGVYVDSEGLLGLFDPKELRVFAVEVDGTEWRNSDNA